MSSEAQKIKNLKQVKQFYAKINNMGVADVDLPENMDRVLRALVQVAGYNGLYDGESEEGRARRQAFAGPANGEVSELSEYFHELYPDRFQNFLSWDTIFCMQNELEAEDGSRMNESGQTIAADSSDTNNLNIKEDLKMADKSLLDEESKVMEERGRRTLGLDGDIKDADGSMPSGDDPVDKASSIAAAKLLEEEKTMRRTNTLNTKVLSIIQTKPAVADLLVDGEDAVGVVSNPKAALSSFMTCTGCAVNDQTHEIVFGNVVDGQLECAKLMYKTLVEAQDKGSDYKLKVYVPKTTPAVHGFRIREADAPSRLLTKDEMTNELMLRTMGWLYAEGNEKVGVILQSAKQSNTKVEDSKASNDKPKTEKRKPSIYTGIISARVSNRQGFIDGGLVELWKQLDTSRVRDDGPAKSALSVKYKGKRESTGKEVTRTFRIPLTTQQYEIAVRDEEMVKTFGDGSTARSGFGKAMPNMEVESEIADRYGELAKFVADVSAKNVGSGIFEAVRKEADELKKKEVNQQAADVADLAL